MIRNILWDIDGVLFDTNTAVTYTISRALSRLGHPVALNVLDNLACLSLDACIDVLAKHFRLDPAQVRNIAEEIYVRIPLSNQPEMPGARALCEWVHRHGGKNLILTHRSTEICRSMLRVHSMEDLIDGIFSAEQGYFPKPDPSMVRAAMTAHALKAEETLMIANRLLDIEAGLRAGVQTCLIGKAAMAGNADFRIQNYDFLRERLEALSMADDALPQNPRFMAPYALSNAMLKRVPSTSSCIPGILIVEPCCDI